MQKNNNPSIKQLFAGDPDRAQRFCLPGPRFLLDYSRVPLTGADLTRLLDWADARDLRAGIRALFGGEHVNTSEDRPALHMALRAPDACANLPEADAGSVAATRDAMLEVAGRLYAGEPLAEGVGPVTDWIHLGIGGSDLGPRLVADALDEGKSAVRVHWLSTLDPRRWQALAARLDPATTGLVIVSKSFSTTETLLQAQAVSQWLGAGWQKRVWAVTAAAGTAVEFGVPQARIFRLPEWVGGRFSLWSAVGLSAAAVIGPAAFRRLLERAGRADIRFRDSDWLANPAVLLALIWHFLRIERGYPAFGVVSYEPRLASLSGWLQQVVMESLGKRVTSDGRALAHASAPLIFGGVGTDLQHSVFQALHQASDAHPVMLLGSVRVRSDPLGWQAVQLSHLLAQGTVLATGREHDDPARALPGGRPSLTLLIDELDPETLAEILVMFEHAVFALGSLWGLNPFDQWGVEEGKRMAGAYRKSLAEGEGGADSQADALLDFIRRHR